jgi:hypothetical protein
MSDVVSKGVEEIPASGASFARNTEFNYRPVSILAPVTLCLGLLSALGFLGIGIAPLGLLGTIIGLVCIVRLHRSRGEYGGMKLAVPGTVMSAVFFTASTALWAHAYRTEVPEGYRRVNFTNDISKKGFVFAKGKKDIFHPDVKALDGQQVFLKGYIYPTKDAAHLTKFLLVKDMNQCCFGGNPAITDMMMVEMEPGTSVEFHYGILVSVAGVFHCQQASGPAGLMPVYRIERARVEKSRTMF